MSSQQATRLTRAEARLIEYFRLLHPGDQRSVVNLLKVWSNPGHRGAATRERNRKKTR